MATSGTKEYVYKYHANGLTFYARFTWWVTNVDIPNNTTTIGYQVTLGGQGGANCSAGKEKYYFQIGDTIESAYELAKNCSFDKNSSITFLSGSKTITHNDDGSASFGYLFEIYLNNAYVATHVAAAGIKMQLTEINIALDNISRNAVILTADNFTDEQNPTITYNNPSKDSVTSLQACISFTGATIDVPYRDISKTGTSYTFALTDAERAVLRRGIASGNSRELRFYVTTVIGGITYYSYLTRTLTLVDYLPTLAPTVRDTNSRTTTLTGDDSKFIRYYSTASVTANARARKDATIASQYIICGSRTVEEDSATFEGVSSNTVYYGVTDSRGYTERDFTVLDMIPYVRLTSSLSLGLLNANGELEFTIGGKYYNGSFGAQSNTMEVEYSAVDSEGNYAFGGGGWVRLGTVTPTMSDDNYTFTHTITGLDHTKTYTITVNVIDELTPVLTTSSVVAALPIFDWNAHDFHHHTDVALSSGRSIIGTTPDGEERVAFEPCNVSGNLVIGAGGYNASEGNTLIYGNNIQLHSKGNVSINGGVVNDFVVEEGSTGTWFYRKWQSGRVELHGYQNISSLACNTGLGGMYRTAVINAPEFPFAVINPKVIGQYESDGYGAFIWPTTRATSLIPWNYYLVRPTSSPAITGVVNFIVTGTY